MEVKKIIVNEDHELFNTDNTYYKQFVSDPRQVRYFALVIAQKAPASILEINLLEQQISELLKNAIKHGNKSDRSKKIQVWYSFSEEKAHIIVQDQGAGFQNLEEWNTFNEQRMQCLADGDFDKLDQFVSFRTDRSDDNDGGNALFAALEYWDLGIVYNNARNAVAVGKKFETRSLRF